jgi:hypothetical protein
MNYIEKVVFKDGLFVLVLDNGSEISGVVNISASASPYDFTMIHCSIGCSELVIESFKKALRDHVEWSANPWKSSNNITDQP